MLERIRSEVVTHTYIHKSTLALYRQLDRISFDKTILNFQRHVPLEFPSKGQLLQSQPGIYQDDSVIPLSECCLQTQML
jgi:hypothetical protein